MDEERLWRALERGDAHAIATLARLAQRRARSGMLEDLLERLRSQGTADTLCAANALGWCPAFVRIPAGSLLIGVPFDVEAPPVEQPQRRVSFSRSIWVSTTAITQGQWRAVMGNNPSDSPHPQRPIQRVNWYEAIAFCDTLSTRLGLESPYLLRGRSGMPGERSTRSQRWRGAFHCSVTWPGVARGGVRLPTEAEWEYAARAGGARDRMAYPDTAWQRSNSHHQSHPVAQRRPNAWGLYDMMGNIAEWCWDRFAAYPDASETDPTGPSTGGLRRVLRGGHWDSDAQTLYPGHRAFLTPHDRASTVGFRVVLSR